jgi:hypothetical protein
MDQHSRGKPFWVGPEREGRYCKCASQNRLWTGEIDHNSAMKTGMTGADDATISWPESPTESSQSCEICSIGFTDHFAPGEGALVYEEKSGFLHLPL